MLKSLHYSKLIVLVILFFGSFQLFAQDFEDQVQISDESGTLPLAKWYTCDVHSAGPAENGNIYIRLSSSGNFSVRWFRAHWAIKKEMLDVALVAIQNNKKVRALLTGTALNSPYSQINRLYIRK